MTSVAHVALSLCKNLGGKTFHALMSAFGDDVDAILKADAEALQQVPGVGAKIAGAIQAVDVVAVARKLDAWRAAGVRVITFNDPEYPRPLTRVEDAPPTLFLRGNMPDLTRAVAVVGTRTPTPQAKDRAEAVAGYVAAQGGVVVSGLALGIDRAAHLGALAWPSGSTIAVLGNGVLNPYPPENVTVAEAILDRGGGLLSEVAPSATVNAAGLVARNRIISGLVNKLIVVQTGIRGGAMHAVRFARTQRRPIYTFPDDADGNQVLLADGALRLTDDFSEFRII